MRRNATALLKDRFETEQEGTDSEQAQPASADRR